MTSIIFQVKVSQISKCRGIYLRGALKAQNGSARSILLILWQFLQVDSCSIVTAGPVEPARLAAFWRRMVRCIAISDSAAIITRAVSGAPIAATNPNTARTCTSTCEGDINTCLFLNQIECNKTSNRRQALDSVFISFRVIYIKFPGLIEPIPSWFRIYLLLLKD